MIKDAMEFERRERIQRLNKDYKPVIPGGAEMTAYLLLLVIGLVVVFGTLAVVKGCSPAPIPKPAASFSPAQKAELVQYYYQRTDDDARQIVGLK